MPSNPHQNNPDSASAPTENNPADDTQPTDTNTNIDLTEIDIDDKSYTVLTTLNDLAGESNTSEITEETGLENHVVNYRFNKLGEDGLGLLRTYHPPQKDGEPTPPKTVELTERGHSAIDAGLLDSHTPNPTLEERVEQLEARNQKLENHIETLVSDLVTIHKGFYNLVNFNRTLLDERGESIEDYHVETRPEVLLSEGLLEDTGGDD